MGRLAGPTSAGRFASFAVQVQRVNALEPTFEPMTDAELKNLLRPVVRELIAAGLSQADIRELLPPLVKSMADRGLLDAPNVAIVAAAIRRAAQKGRESFGAADRVHFQVPHPSSGENRVVSLPALGGGPR